MDNRWLAGKNQRGPAAISESQSKVDNCEGWITDDVGFNLKQLANSAVLSSGKINGHLVQNVQYYFFSLQICGHRSAKVNFWEHYIWQHQRNIFTKGRVRLPNRMIFWKNSKRPSNPPPSFLENYIANFLWQIWLHFCEEIWWLDSMKCMHMISRYRCDTIVIQYNCWK